MAFSWPEYVLGFGLRVSVGNWAGEQFLALQCVYLFVSQSRVSKLLNLKQGQATVSKVTDIIVMRLDISL
jgi:hypothetical protein